MLESKPKRAKNQALFREVNERIEGVATEFAVPDMASFICECGDAECTEMLSLTLEEYGRIRTHGTRFAILLGHEDLSIEQVIAANDRFAVVEKTGEAGQIANSLDPRDG